MCYFNRHLSSGECQSWSENWQNVLSNPLDNFPLKRAVMLCIELYIQRHQNLKVSDKLFSTRIKVLALFILIPTDSHPSCVLFWFRMYSFGFRIKCNRQGQIFCPHNTISEKNEELSKSKVIGTVLSFREIIKLVIS